MNKMTKKVALEIALSAIENNETKEYTHMNDKGEVITFTADEAMTKIKEMFASLEAQNKARGTTQKQKQNEGFKKMILNLLEDSKARTATEILKECEGLPEEMTGQRITALLTQLKEAGKVKKDIVKKKPVYFIAD